AHDACAFRRVYRHRADELRLRLEFRISDEAAAHRVIGIDESLYRCRHRFLVDGVFHVEVEPAALRADVAAGDAEAEYRAQQVQRGVHAHVPVAPLPVDRRADGAADGGQG